MCSLDLYFNAAPYVMYYTYASAPAGTITLSYTISNLVLRIEDVWSDLIEASINSKGLNFSYTEMYWQQTPITPSAQSISILALVRKTSDITAINAGLTSAPTSSVVNKLRQYTGDLTEVTKANVIIAGIPRYAEDLSTSLALVHELKKLFPSAQYSDYFQNITTNGTTNSMYVFRIGRDIGETRESGVDCSSLSAAATLNMTWTSALQNTNYVLDMFVIHTRYITISGSGDVVIRE